jgi:hypothetical protein
MRIVCWFSCGAASAVATKIALQKYKGQEIVVARCIVREEHRDNDRFAEDCEKWFGVKITNLINEKYDGSIHNVIYKRQYVSGTKGAPCTFELKKSVRLKFQLPTDKHIFGYCSEEQSRWDHFLDANNIDAESPLIENGLQHSDCLSMIERAGIELPAMYKLGYHHNNCIGCVKSGGMGYWNKIRVDFPEQFNKMATVSRKLNARLINDGGEHKFLDELEVGRGDYQKEPEIQCGIFCEMAEREYKS